MDNSREMIAAKRRVSRNGRPKGKGKRKIEIKERDVKESKFVTFSKRRKGLYRKADFFNSLTGYTYAVIVFSPMGRLFTHGNPSFDEAFGNYLKHMKEKEAKRNAKKDVKTAAKKETEKELERGDNGTYLKHIKEKEAKRNAKKDAKAEVKIEPENELERGDNELVTWLRAIPLEEYDDVEELVMLKEKLLEFKEKVRAKISGEVNQLTG